MRRRDFIVLAGGTVVTAPFAARAQQKAMPVIGFLGAATADLPSVIANVAAFHRGLGEAGYVENQNLAVEYRWAEGHYERLPALAVDLLGRKVDLIATMGGTPSAAAAKSATTTIPIVFVTGDPVGQAWFPVSASPAAILRGLVSLQLS